MQEKSFEDKLHTASEWGMAMGIVAGVGRFVVDLVRGRSFDQAASGAVETGITIGASTAVANLAKNTIAQDLPSGQAELMAASAAVIGREAVRTIFENPPKEVDMAYLTKHVR
jgi:hypothetical protein